MQSLSIEDYLENIYLLIQTKGYARGVDIAQQMKVNPSSVTRMIQKLSDDGYAIYEKYRGLILTAKGQAIAKEMVQKHQLLEKFLLLIGVSSKYIESDVEGIEHHISGNTAFCIAALVRFFEENTEIKEAFNRYLLTSGSSSWDSNGGTL